MFPKTHYFQIFPKKKNNNIIIKMFNAKNRLLNNSQNAKFIFI